MSTTPNFNLPLLTATQAGKEITVNEALTLIDSLLATQTGGTSGGTSTLTAEQLAALFISQPQLVAIIEAELAQLPTPVTLTQLQQALAAQPVPATVADVQNAVAGISAGSGSGAVAGAVGIFSGPTPAGWQRLTSAKDFSRSKVSLGPKTATVATGAYPGAAFSPLTGKYYYLDAYRGFVEYDPLTGSQTTLQSPPSGFASTGTYAPPLSAMADGRLMTAGGSNGKYVSIFDPVGKTWITGPTLPTAQYDGLLLREMGGSFLFLGGHSSTMAQINTSTATSIAITAPLGRSLSSPKGCVLPSGSRLVLLALSASPYTHTTYTLAPNVGSGAWEFMAKPGFPADTTVLSVVGTSYGALLVVKDTQVRLLKYTEATDTYTYMNEYVGTLAAGAMAVDGTDQAVLISETGNTGPGLFLVNAANSAVVDIYYAVKL